MDFVQKMVLVPYDKYERLTLDKHTKEEDNYKVNKLDDETILIAIPNTFKNKAKALLKYLSLVQGLNWNEQGEIIIDNTVLPKSNICDLIKDCLREYKQFNPIGYNEFYEKLSTSNVPLSLIANTKRREFIQSGRGDKPFASPIPPPPGIPIQKKKKHSLQVLHSPVQQKWEKY